MPRVGSNELSHIISPVLAMKQRKRVEHSLTDDGHAWPAKLVHNRFAADDFQQIVMNKNNPFHVQGLYHRNLLARIAIYYCFMLEGVFNGVWGRYIPEIQATLQLSDSLLGTSVTFGNVGTVLAAPLVAYLVTRFGTRITATAGAWLFIASLPLIGMASDFTTLTMATFAYGLTCGIMDISINSGAILTEIVVNAPLLGGFHGSYSIAAALGALQGGLFIQSGRSTLSAFTICSVIAIVLSLLTFFHMYDREQETYLTSHQNDSTTLDTESDSSDPSSESTHGSAVPKEDGSLQTNDAWKTLSVLAAIGFFAAFGETSLVTWSTVFFEREIHANSVVKSLGLTCFMVCMGVGRFSCDYLRRQVGRRLMTRFGGLMAMLGLLLASVSIDLPFPVVFACLGLSITGLGLSTVIPIAFSSAGHLQGIHGATAMAIVAGCTYCGSIVSPLLVGMLSDTFDSLRIAILYDGLFLGVIVPISFGMPAESMVFQHVSHHEDSAASESDERAVC